MPTISQLPTATAVSATDTIPISQGGTARSASVATILGTVQPAIIVASPSLVGRSSLGSGGPEQIGIGQGLVLSNTTLVADGLDHSGFPVATNFDVNSDLVISAQGQPMIMPASLLRGLFTAGQNISITPMGAISATAVGGNDGITELGSAIGALEAITSLSAQDLVAVSEAGVDRSISYANLLNGLTIDKAQVAAPASDTDAIWSAQGSNILTRQNLGAIWTWISSKILTYKISVVEITSNISLNASSHNAHLLICSQAITLTPMLTNMGNGFVCTVINASAGNVTLDAAFVTSNGSRLLSPWQSATIFCATYSGGNIPFVSICGAASSSIALPGQVLNVTGISSGATSITVTWSAPTSGGPISSYLLQYRIYGAASWTSCPAILGALAYQVTNLQAATSYDFTVQGSNPTGTGPASNILTLATTSTTTTVSPQVVGLTVISTSITTVQLSWSAPTSAASSTTYTVQYRTTGSQAWTWSVPSLLTTSTTISGLLAGTSYDFSVYCVTASGAGIASASVTASTSKVVPLVNSITWNLLPSGTYNRSSGAIGVNAHVSPTTSSVQFGFSSSASIPPTAWTQAVFINSDLWGAYVPTPTSAGTWFVWGEGVDGSAVAVSSSSFNVQ